MSNLLKGLKLEEPELLRVDPFEFDLSTVETLLKWFKKDAIAELEKFVAVAKQMEKISAQEPALSDVRDVMVKISELAAALSTALEKAPSVVQAELDLIGHKSFENWAKSKLIALDLEILAEEMQKRISLIPSQGRRKSHTFLVSGIAAAAESVGVKLSDSEHSKFHKVCSCIFTAAGIHQDPRGSIREFIKSQDIKGARKVAAVGSSN